MRIDRLHKGRTITRHGASGGGKWDSERGCEWGQKHPGCQRIHGMQSMKEEVNHQEWSVSLNRDKGYDSMFGSYHRTGVKGKGAVFNSEKVNECLTRWQNTEEDSPFILIGQTP